MFNDNPRGLELWIDDFGEFELYEDIPDVSSVPSIGQFYVGHIRYPFCSAPKVLEIDNLDRENELDTTFRIADYNPLEERQSCRPIKQLNLSSGERLYISAGKRRTVILLRTIKNIWRVDREENLALCIPISSFKRQHSQKHIVDIQLFRFPQYFYIKPNDKGARSQSAARFDLIQYVPIEYLSPVRNSENKQFKLSPYILKLLFNHLNIYMFEKPFDADLQKEILAFQNMLLAEPAVKAILESN